MELSERVGRALGLTELLARAVPEDALASKLPSAKSNALGDQFWCILGARESFLRAAEAGKWVGFDCSLDVLPGNFLADFYSIGRHGKQK